MEGTKDDEHTCSIPETDDAGHPNLCCCYFMDAEGGLQDACYHPPDECC